ALRLADHRRRRPPCQVPRAERGRGREGDRAPRPGRPRLPRPHDVPGARHVRAARDGCVATRRPSGLRRRPRRPPSRLRRPRRQQPGRLPRQPGGAARGRRAVRGAGVGGDAPVERPSHPHGRPCGPRRHHRQRPAAAPGRRHRRRALLHPLRQGAAPRGALAAGLLAASRGPTGRRLHPARPPRPRRGAGDHRRQPRVQLPPDHLGARWRGRPADPAAGRAGALV
ncbi:MAG: hypothetical protein AVDCRST_MAG20-2214, partial [uncultured Acidimicrobiales bacterium]